jgi:hypothetical protein
MLPFQKHSPKPEGRQQGCRACFAGIRSDFKITFKTDWIDWNDLAVVTFSDASFASEAEYKSQQGRIHYITSRIDVKSGEHKFHHISPDWVWIVAPEASLSSHTAGRGICSAGMNKVWIQTSSFAL